MVIGFVAKDLLWYCGVKGEMTGREQDGYCMVADQVSYPSLNFDRAQMPGANRNTGRTVRECAGKQ